MNKFISLTALVAILTCGCTTLSDQDRALLTQASQNAQEAKQQATQAEATAHQALDQAKSAQATANGAAQSAAQAAADAKAANEKADRIYRRSLRK